MLDERSLSRVQRALADAGLDGWLIYDFRGLNPVAKTMLGSKAWRLGGSSGSFP